MGRPRKNPIKELKQESAIDSIMKSGEGVELHEMPLESLSDYQAYNEKARQLNKKAGLCRYSVKQCPVELHPTQRIIFNRNDQPDNPQPVYVSNELIEFKETLTPGKEYDLPICIVDHLYAKGTPIWKWYDNPDGSRETRVSHNIPRFALRSVMA